MKFSAKSSSLIGTLITLFLPLTLIAQQRPEQVIARIIDSGAFEGHDQKVIGYMGDAAAVVVTKHLAGRKLSEAEIDGALVVLTGAFADATFVKDEADRQPRTALLLLRYFDLSADDVKLKARIAEAKKYIEAHTSD